MRSTGNPRCWKPPTQCFKVGSQCLMYLSAGGVGDQCAPNTQSINDTAHTTTYTCKHVVQNPTPIPTPPPVDPSSLNVLPPKSAVNHANLNAYEQQSDSELLSYLNEYKKEDR